MSKIRDSILYREIVVCSSSGSGGGSGGGGSDSYTNFIEGTSTELSDENAKVVRTNAFSNNKYITKASFLNATEIGENAFYYCTSLVSLNAPKAEILQRTALSHAESLQELVLDSCKKLCYYSVNACYALEKLVLPALEEIESSAIRDVSKLASIAIGTQDSTNIVKTGSSLADIPSATTIYVPDALVETYKTTGAWKQVADRIKGLSEYI